MTVRGGLCAPRASHRARHPQQRVPMHNTGMQRTASATNQERGPPARLLQPAGRPPRMQPIDQRNSLQFAVSGEQAPRKRKHNTNGRAAPSLLLFCSHTFFKSSFQARRLLLRPSRRSSRLQIASQISKPARTAPNNNACPESSRDPSPAMCLPPQTIQCPLTAVESAQARREVARLLSRRRAHLTSSLCSGIRRRARTRDWLVCRRRCACARVARGPATALPRSSRSAQ